MFFFIFCTAAHCITLTKATFHHCKSWLPLEISSRVPRSLLGTRRRVLDFLVEQDQCVWIGSLAHSGRKDNTAVVQHLSVVLSCKVPREADGLCFGVMPTRSLPAWQFPLSSLLYYDALSPLSLNSRSKLVAGTRYQLCVLNLYHSHLRLLNYRFQGRCPTQEVF